MKTLRVMLRSICGGLLLSLGAWTAGAQPSIVQPLNPPEPAPAPEVAPAPPPSAPPKRSTAELEQLVAPIALYPDPLVATILPASVYPLEIVQAARFVAHTNNLAQLDAQPWDENVKAVARVPTVIQKMNDDLQWTVALGEAFLAQEKEVMEAIQNLRGKAQQAGTLQTTPQQVVVVTNEVVQRTVEQQVVVVTNTIVQIVPSNPQVVYVPQYDPVVVYAPPPTYVYNPVAPLVTFGVGVAVGAVIANNCDWHGGGVYVGPHGMAVWGGGGYHGDVDVDVNRNVNVNNQARARSTTTATGQQKWQPDPNRVRTSGAAGTYASNAEARGWDSGTRQASTRATGTRAPSGTAPARTGGGTPPAARSTAATAPNRPSASPSAAPPRSAPSARSSSAGGSAFSGVNSGASARSYSSRGAASRGGSRGGGRR